MYKNNRKYKKILLLIFIHTRIYIFLFLVPKFFILISIDMIDWIYKWRKVYLKKRVILQNYVDSKLLAIMKIVRE